LDDVVPENTPVGNLIRYFTTQVVLRGKEVVGVVDASDLNKNPVYTYFYLLLSVVEHNLLALVRRLPSTTDWGLLIGAERWGECQSRWQAAKANRSELDQLSYLYFADYLAIVRGSPALLESLNFASKNLWDKHTGALDNSRNDVAHPVRDLVGPHRGIEELFSLEQRIRTLIQRSSRSAPLEVGCAGT
jgi:hypothetical protein